jgi:hypothetical protein
MDRHVDVDFFPLTSVWRGICEAKGEGALEDLGARMGLIHGASTGRVAMITSGIPGTTLMAKSQKNPLRY